MTAPEGMNIWDEDDPDMTAVRLAADKIVQNVRRDSPRRTINARRLEIGTIKHRRPQDSLTQMQSSRDTTPG